MKRAVICTNNPQDYIDQVVDYSVMIVDPRASDSRKNYLLDNADWSLLITDQGHYYRDGQDYPNEKLLWYTSGTTGDVMTTVYTGITTTSDFFSFNSGATKALSISETGSKITAINHTTNYFVLQMTVTTTASPGTTVNETATIQYDEI